MPNPKIRAHTKFDRIVARLKQDDHALLSRLNSYNQSFQKSIPNIDDDIPLNNILRNVFSLLQNVMNNKNSNPFFPDGLPLHVYQLLDEFFADILG